MRGKPYRNGAIISAIGNLYFNGPTMFASQFRQLFPTFNSLDGEKIEVPIPMVALVGTAVRVSVH